MASLSTILSKLNIITMEWIWRVLDGVEGKIYFPLLKIIMKQQLMELNKTVF